jgi:polyphosphate kinase
MSPEAPTASEYIACMQNRELSWLKFNGRVLEEAGVATTPLIERLKFISIFTSNLDEFYMIRVGSLVDNMIYAPESIDNKTGMSAEEQLAAIYAETGPLYKLRDNAFHQVMTELAQRGVCYLKPDALDPEEMSRLDRYFQREVKPFLSPQIIDNRHPFPHIGNEQIHIAVTLAAPTTKKGGKAASGGKNGKSGGGDEKNDNAESGNEKSGKTTVVGKGCIFGIIAIPAGIERMYWLSDEKDRFLLLEDIIFYYAETVFQIYAIQEKTIIKVTRNADINMEEGMLDEDVDYLEHMKKIIKKRPRLAPVRLSLQYPVNPGFNDFLCKKLKLNSEQVFLGSAPLDLSFCFALEELLVDDQRRDLFWPVHDPVDLLADNKNLNMLELLRKKDLLLAYPFESMHPFLSIIRQSSEDPAVLSIKITLYRIDKRSRLAEYLINAAENGKEVIVLMEVRARFDENNNIEWARRLEEAGCRVIYGHAGFKVHSKVCLITRREQSRIEYITHVGTGNFNEKTAKLYTDLSLITVDPEIGLDAVDFFNNLMLGNLYGDYRHFWVAPHAMKSNIIAAIEGEQARSEAGASGEIIIKCNSLTDKEIIMKLIDASRSGVRVRMIVRGIFCLIPHIPEWTDKISDISIVGRFLEHSRIFCFGGGENQTIYISSADLMTRNTQRRVEVACPVRDPDLKDRLRAMLETMLADNTKAHEQFANGQFVLRRPLTENRINSQEAFVSEAKQWTDAAMKVCELPPSAGSHSQTYPAPQENAPLRPAPQSRGFLRRFLTRLGGR